MDVVGVDVVLDHVLVDPGDGAAADPVLGGPQDPVDVGVAGDGAVVGVVLDVETWRRQEKVA